MLASFVVALFAGRSVVLVLVVVVVLVVVLDVALQAFGILNQLRVSTVSRDERSRLNTAYVTCNFLGGTVGSAAAAVLWSAGRWTAVSIAGITLSPFALADAGPTRGAGHHWMTISSRPARRPPRGAARLGPLIVVE